VGKLISTDEAMIIRRDLRDLNRAVVFTNGVFDLIHIGHVRYLQAARALGDVLFVGVNSDRSARQIKGPGRPLTPQSERAEVLAALACVDYVLVFDEPTAKRLVGALQPDVYAKGGDYASEGRQGKPLPEAAAVHKYGGRIEILPYLGEYSTSRIVERVLRAECPQSDQRVDTH
jgi:rfaE bifunctional protein nucleotidyltransferase chain/domain